MTDKDSSWLIEHRKGTRKDARQALLLNAVLFPIFFSIGLFILWRVHDRRFAGFWFGILVVVTLIQLVIARMNWKADAEFVCRLSAQWLECQCPVKGLGESFRVAVSEIEGLEESSGDSPSWYVWAKDGRRYWLTSNYGNPAFRIVQKLRDLRPELRD